MIKAKTLVYETEIENPITIDDLNSDDEIRRRIAEKHMTRW